MTSRDARGMAFIAYRVIFWRNDSLLTTIGVGFLTLERRFWISISEPPD